MNIFTVTTLLNLPSLVAAIGKHEELHDYESYTVICPEREIKEFENRLINFPKIQIISEDKYLSINKFLDVCNKTTSKISKEKINEFRVNWYYQQVLKITYVLASKKEKIVMWDADSIPIRSIQFFNESESVSYGSATEYHDQYFETISDIFKFERPEMAFTIQFFTVTALEIDNLCNLLSTYEPIEVTESVGEWVARVIITSVARRNIDLSRKYQSYFSEQELVGLTNRVLHPSNQFVIKHFRPARYWENTKLRLSIISMFGYKYYTIERNKITKSYLAEIIYFWCYFTFDLFRFTLVKYVKLNKNLKFNRGKIFN